MLVDGDMGAAGRTVVVEDMLVGRETSAMAFTDGKTVKHMPFSCDHKPVFDGNRGPNTGGMGVYVPPSSLDASMAAAIRRDVTEAAVRAMAAEEHRSGRTLAHSSRRRPTRHRVQRPLRRSSAGCFRCLRATCSKSCSRSRTARSTRSTCDGATTRP
jgi:hypothetical protein